MVPHFVIEKQLTSEHIESFCALEKTLSSDDINSGKNYTKEALQIGITKEKNIPENMLNEIYSSIKNIVEKETGVMYPTYGVFSESVTPMTEHIDVHHTQSDYNKDPAYTIIIPLSTNIECNTVVWNVTKIKEHLPIFPRNTVKHGWTPYKLTSSERQAISHCSIISDDEWGKPSIYSHTKGNIICFKRNYVHASSNAIQNPIKRFILLLTRFSH